MTEMDSNMAENAVSVYGQTNAMDDFPVLKAFQQYIDAEQAKARKRLMIICAFFGFFLVLVVTFFVILLVNFSARNQQLNDRLVEYAMNERNRQVSAPVVVQSPQDSAALMTMTSKLDELQRKLAESQVRADKIAEEAAEKAKKATEESAKAEASASLESEIKKLRSLLAAENEKTAAEREKKRQEELEAYRRKHYPECYGEKRLEEPKAETRREALLKKRRLQREMEEADAEIDDILNDVKAIRYYDEEEPEPTKPTTKAPSRQPVPARTENNYSIPVEIKGSSSSWSIPLD